MSKRNIYFILALSGSLQANSYNTGIVKYLQTLSKSLEVYDALNKLPLFNLDLDMHTLEEDKKY